MESLCFARLCVMPPVMVSDFFFFFFLIIETSIFGFMPILFE